MRAKVKGQGVGDSKCFAANLTAVRLLASVHPFMLNLLVGSREDSSTILARKSWFLLARGTFFTATAGGAAFAALAIEGLTLMNP